MDQILEFDLSNVVDDVLVLDAGYVVVAAGDNLALGDDAAVDIAVLLGVGLLCAEGLCGVVAADGLLHVLVAGELRRLAEGDVAEQHQEVLLPVGAAVVRRKPADVRKVDAFPKPVPAARRFRWGNPETLAQNTNKLQAQTNKHKQKKNVFLNQIINFVLLYYYYFTFVRRLPCHRSFLLPRGILGT